MSAARLARIRSACSARRVPLQRGLRVQSCLTGCLLPIGLEGDICSQDLVSLIGKPRVSLSLDEQGAKRVIKLV